MKKGAIIGIIVGVVVLVLVAVGGYMFYSDSMQKAKIIETFAEIEELTKSGDFEMEQLEEKTNTIVSSGKYADVEKAAKNYAHDLFSKAFEMKSLLQDEKMAQLLTASNYEADGPEFAETKKYISETKQKLQDGKTEMLAFIEEDKINSYIEAETNDSYSIDLYRQLLSEDIEMPESEKKELETSVDKVISMLEIEEEIINCLVENNGKWRVQGEQVLFESNSLVTQYNGYLNKLRIF